MGFSDEKLKGLLKKMQNGEGIERERATGEFLKFYYPIMKGYFHGCFKINSKTEVEDLSQNILVRLLKNNIVIENNFRRYLYLVAKTSFINYRKSKHKKVFFEELSERLQSSDSIYYPGILLDYKIKEKLFYKHHKKIRGKKIQERFQSWLNGASHKEIAQKEGICVGASKSILFHIRDQEGQIFFEEPKQNPYRV